MNARIRSIVWCVVSLLASASCGERLPNGQKVQATGAPCPIAGHWEMRLRRDSTARLGDRQRAAVGWVALVDSGGSSVPTGRGTAGPVWRGTFDVALDSLFGPGEGGVASTSVESGTPEQIRTTVHAYMLDTSTIQIHLSPLVSHGPLSLTGHLHGDTITGRWRQRSEDYLGAPTGLLVMWRRQACRDQGA